MKIRFLSLILVLMLLPVASIFTACGKDKTYNLNSLDEDYYSIAEEFNNMKFEDDKLMFTYENFGNLNTAVNSIEPYTQLKHYNEVFTNLTSFVSLYVDECANNSNGIGKEIKTQVETDLKEFKAELNSVNNCTNILADTLNTHTQNPTAETCLVRYENLLKSYEYAYIKATNLHNTLSNLYYNFVLNVGNPNIANVSVEDFDANTVINKLRSRIEYQRGNLSVSFVEMYVAGGNLAHAISHGEQNFNYIITINGKTFDYQANIEALNKSFDEVTGYEKAVKDSATKQYFYELSVKAYNLQEVLNANSSKFVYACNSINYNDVDNNSTPIQHMCKNIIEENLTIITTYNDVLAGMLSIVK